MEKINEDIFIFEKDETSILIRIEERDYIFKNINTQNFYLFLKQFNSSPEKFKNKTLMYSKFKEIGLIVDIKKNQNVEHTSKSVFWVNSQEESDLLNKYNEFKEIITYSSTKEESNYYLILKENQIYISKYDLGLINILTKEKLSMNNFYYKHISYVIKYFFITDINSIGELLDEVVKIDINYFNNNLSIKHCNNLTNENILNSIYFDNELFNFDISNSLYFPFSFMKYTIGNDVFTLLGKSFYSLAYKILEIFNENFLINLNHTLEYDNNEIIDPLFFNNLIYLIFNIQVNYLESGEYACCLNYNKEFKSTNQEEFLKYIYLNFQNTTGKKELL